MDPVLLAGLCAIVTAGACLHRVAGIGLGMVVAPALTLAIGAEAGVTFSNCAAVVTSVVVLLVLRADVDWPHFWRLAPLIVVGSVLGAVTVRVTAASWLDVLVGASVLGALAAMPLTRTRFTVHGRTAAMTVGLTAGFLNTTSGVAAPALTAYALAIRWEQKSFAATLQPILLTANLSSLVTKAAVGAVPTDLVPWWTWPLVAGAVCGGVGLGSLLARRVSSRAAGRLAVTVAAVGATVALLRGLLAV
ncbi:MULTISPECIES: sulfite exporter TauE/SafE family protein [Nocardioides]|uniref:Probable membrane transporter protein n=1 Tax=Nocardioides vastitatis TaxID=2568655 RepID=A0ABW0ZJ45_9ACTN|nr:sulfite exporter TauE/SafE family protein [Nocardioides sp.]